MYYVPGHHDIMDEFYCLLFQMDLWECVYVKPVYQFWIVLDAHYNSAGLREESLSCQQVASVPVVIEILRILAR